MDDDLDQLLTSLKMTRAAEILPELLERAQREGWGYSQFLSRVLREEHQAREMRFLGHRVRRAHLPEPWTLETFPWERQPWVKRAGAAPRFSDESGRLHSPCRAVPPTSIRVQRAPRS